MDHPSVKLGSCRADFPSLARTVDGRPLVFLDGPAGTQVPYQVIEAMDKYYRTSNANSHGPFLTSVETDAAIEQTRQAACALLGAPHPRTISFGANMTTLTFSLSRGLSRAFREGDRVLVSGLDHEANRGPWLSLEERGVIVDEIGITPDCTLDESDLRGKITPRTRLVAIGGASNAFGTVNNIALARELSRKVGAWLLIDAVHFAPHFPLDVVALDVDFLLCSAYKFYGPHVGILYAREGLLETLEVDRLRTQDQDAPYRIETGTLNHAALAGVTAAIEYIASFGDGVTLRERIVAAMGALGRHERWLGSVLFESLQRIPGVTVHGQSFDVPLRAPTLAITSTRMPAPEISGRLAKRNIFTWAGHFYAIRPMELLGLLGRGGVVRAGISAYTAPEDVESYVTALEEELRR
jgi:cysteine desulfurase family protein (TIGR01976 family)